MLQKVEPTPPSVPFRVFQRVGQTAAAFRPGSQPFMVRRNYSYELKSALTFPLAAALAEGTFTGVVASKYFAAGPFLIAVITAAPMFGNILALLWSELADTLPKVRFINGLQVGVAASMALVAGTYFIPSLALAGWAFATLIIIARVLASGIVTLRSAVWRLNYPKAIRGQIISRINGVYNAVLAAMVLASAFALDREPASFALIYPAIAVVSLLGILQFSRIRVRGEGAMLRRKLLRPAGPAVDADGNETLGWERAESADPGESALRRLRTRVRDAFALLRSDQMFREYQWWQFLLGASFMMMFPSLIYMVSKEMTDPRTEYVRAVVILQFVPMITGVVFLQVWAPIFDRMPLLDFRKWLGVTGLVAHSLILLGAVTNQLWVVGLGTFSIGVSMGGGQLAWQLGQNAFATKDNVGTYMGLHVMLTGMRGMLAPFLGVGIYHLLSRLLSDPFGHPGGRLLFLLPVILCTISLFGYASMAKRYRGVTRETDDSPA